MEPEHAAHTSRPDQRRHRSRYVMGRPDYVPFARRKRWRTELMRSQVEGPGGGERFARAITLAVFLTRTSRGAVAILSAVCATVDGKSSRDATRYTIPSASASDAETARPVNIRSRATAPPTRSCSGP